MSDIWSRRNAKMKELITGSLTLCKTSLNSDFGTDPSIPVGSNTNTVKTVQHINKLYFAEFSSSYRYLLSLQIL